MGKFHDISHAATFTRQTVMGLKTKGPSRLVVGAVIWDTLVPLRVASHPPAAHTMLLLCQHIVLRAEVEADGLTDT